MVDKALRTAFKAEHEIENQMTSGKPGGLDAGAEKSFKQFRSITEEAVLTAVKGPEKLGKKALDKIKEMAEEITF